LNRRSNRARLQVVCWLPLYLWVSPWTVAVSVLLIPRLGRRNIRFHRDLCPGVEKLMNVNPVDITWTNDSKSKPANTRLRFDLEDCFDFDRRIRRNLSEAQGATRMVSVGCFTKHLVQQIATTIDDQMLLMKFQGGIHTPQDL